MKKEKIRVTPWVKDLGRGEIFVFGSNTRGMHIGGAARLAFDKFGAIWGEAEGLQGQSYAIPTVDYEEKEPVGYYSLRDYVNTFTEFARKNPGYLFYVTEIGCGIAGGDPMNIGKAFYHASKLGNVYLPESFWTAIEKLEEYWAAHDKEIEDRHEEGRGPWDPIK